eukprot:g17401.t1
MAISSLKKLLCSQVSAGDAMKKVTNAVGNRQGQDYMIEEDPGLMTDGWGISLRAAEETEEIREDAKALLGPASRQGCRGWSLRGRVVPKQQKKNKTPTVSGKEREKRFKKIARKSAGGILLMNYEKRQRRAFLSSSCL